MYTERDILRIIAKEEYAEELEKIEKETKKLKKETKELKKETKELKKETKELKKENKELKKEREKIISTLKFVRKHHNLPPDAKKIIDSLLADYKLIY
ncbi:MAG: hypothetical protein IJ287_11395 [Methanobrevibacter sp.]|nr:hypothetical protein [Methanobrevibacter sp.]